MRKIVSKVLTRSDTSANWSKNNPVLGKGECGYATDLRRTKHGDGTTKWNDLKWDDAATANGHSINSDVPAGAKFTDTTYTVATTSANGLMSAADKSKLDGIDPSAITTTYGIATSSTDGLMSAADKAKLDGIGAGANVKSVNGKTGAVTISKADVGLENVDNTSDADKPYYKLIGQTTNADQIGHFNFNDASRSLYKIKNFYAASGEGDYFYLAHKKSDYTITATNQFSNTDGLFTAVLSSAGTCTIATDRISESDPAILTIVRKDELNTRAEDLTLIFYDYMGQPSNASLKHWKLESMAYTGHRDEWEWRTVFERTNVSDSINCLWCGVNPNKYHWDYPYIKGIRITIYAATPWSAASWESHVLKIAGMRLLDSGDDSGPSFSPAEALGALDVAGGTVYGETTFQEGISATSYSGATATSSADGLMSKEDKKKLNGFGSDIDHLAKNTAQIETALTATNVHSVGEYVMISNALYKVTASVAKGDMWIFGTNVTATNIGSEIGSLKSDLVDKLYPVGSIYMSVNATNPAELFGGTWEHIKGRFLIGAGANDANTTDFWGHEDAHHYNILAGELGGEAQHTLTVDEMPSHIHEHIYGVSGSQEIYFENNSGNSLGAHVGNNTSNSSSNYRTIAYTGNAGGGKPHNNMPPYLAVYMWKRTA